MWASVGIGLSEVNVKFSTKNKPRVGSFAPIIFSVEWKSEQTMMACVSRAPFVLNIYGGKYTPAVPKNRSLIARRAPNPLSNFLNICIPVYNINNTVNSTMAVESPEITRCTATEFVVVSNSQTVNLFYVNQYSILIELKQIKSIIIVYSWQSPGILCVVSTDSLI